MSREPFMPLTLLTGEKKESSRTPDCGKCGLKVQCRRPMMPPSGSGKRKILVVTDRVRGDEENFNCHLAGQYGRDVSEVFRKYGIELREDCWATSATICNGPPTSNAVEYCRANLLNTIDKLKPEVIILLGPEAHKSLVGDLSTSSTGAEDRLAGYLIPSVALNAWVCPTFHPHRAKTDGMNEVSKVLFSQHVEAISKLRGRPYTKVPDYSSRIRVYTSPKLAAKFISENFQDSRMISFDYETTTLKPDGPHAKIVSCAISDGEVSVAYPWHGLAIEATKNILRNPKVKKIAANAKFEDRWTRRILGIDIKGWLWDTVLAAHILDNNTKVRHIASVKFQAFVHLGVPEWDIVVGPYLESEKDRGEKQGNAKNRIDEVDLQSLLRYNAYDSLYEFLIANLQMRRLKEGVSCGNV